LKWLIRGGLAIATIVYLVYSSFGIAAPFWWGHHGYHGATYMLRARMSLRLHMLTPANWTGFDHPPLNALYFHHPIGYHHVLTLLVPIFGEHEWLARGVAALGGLLALGALYALVRRAWSREAGLLAVAVYVALPVITSFSVLSDPMLPAFACVCWALWAYYDLLEKPSRRAIVHAAFAYGVGGLIMWESYFIAPFIALHALLYRGTARGRTLRLGRWSALDLHTLVTGAVCTATMAFHIWFTRHAGAWDEFLQSYSLRHSPPSAQWVIDRHTAWLEILFGAPAVFVGCMWLIVFVARLATKRARRRDLLPLTFLYVNTIYIYMFAEGSSVHLYRVFFFSGFFTLAVVDLVTDAARGMQRLGGRRSLAAATGIALAALWLGVEAPHAYANLLESRIVMGTHSQPGYGTDAEKLVFAAEVTRQTKPDERVIVESRQLGSRKELWYYLDRSFDETSSLTDMNRFRATREKSVVIYDERQLTSSERTTVQQLLREHPVTYYGRYAMIDLRSHTPGARSFELVPGPMSRAYRWFVSEKYPPLRLARRAYLPGLCDAVAVGAPVARDEALPAPPTDPKLNPCWHNYLIARGESATAVHTAYVRATSGLAAPANERTLGKARVVGVNVAGTRLRVAFIAAGPESGDVRYRVKRGTQTGLVGRSDAVPPPAQWRAGYVYVDEVTLPPGPVAPIVDAELWEPAPPPKPAMRPVAMKVGAAARAAANVLATAPVPPPAPPPVRILATAAILP
jgi:Dolichyl-phosphate-mannose-protein mannosyltransferase